MKISIESTDKLTTIDGVPVRVWEGVTERGIHCKVLVHRLVIEADVDSEQFERELKEELPPGLTFPLAIVL